MQTLQKLVPSVDIHYTDQEVLTDISYAVDSSKLMALGFQPHYTLEQGLSEMLARFRGFHAKQ
jgi:nucleoside-diphosphate-sugar epimerase